MNRRQFLASAGLGPLVAHLGPIRETRKSITIAQHIEVNMILAAHMSDETAEHHRRSWIGRPFESFGEFYVDRSEVRLIPKKLVQLHGTLTHHNTTIGVAAEQREYLVGAFRRDFISIIVRIIGDQEQTMLAIAEHVANTNLPSRFEAGWKSVWLESFVPDSGDLGSKVEESIAFWP